MPCAMPQGVSLLCRNLWRHEVGKEYVLSVRVPVGHPMSNLKTKNYENNEGTKNSMDIIGTIKQSGRV